MDLDEKNEQLLIDFRRTWHLYPLLQAQDKGRMTIRGQATSSAHLLLRFNI